MAAADIRAGDAITAEAVTVQDVPATYRAASALGGEALDAEGLAAGGRAIVDIPAGTQLSSSFVTGMEAIASSAELGAGLCRR
ncbi:MAG: SAF domain-containing protein [Eggerthella lenta]